MPASFLAAITLLVLAACAPTESNSTEGGPGGRGPVEFTAETSTAASATVTSDAGAEITAMASDGTEYRLTIAAGSVLDDTTITMTPLVDLAGGIGEPQVGVLLEPDGLELLTPATLTISGGAAASPPELRLFFSAAHDGSDQVPVGVASGGRLILHHFSIAGWTGVNDSAYDAAFGVVGGDIANEVERSIQRVSQDAENGSATAKDLQDAIAAGTERLEREVLRPYLDSVGTEPRRCSSVAEAERAVLRVERELAIYGVERTGPSTTMIELLTADYADCEREKIRACKSARDPSILVAFWVTHAHKLAVVGFETSMNPIELLTKAKAICEPQRYTASGGGGGMTASGEVGDITRPFTLTGSGDGFAITMTYLPAEDGRSGTMTYEGGGSGVAMSGSSTYTVGGEEGGPLVLEQTGAGCVNHGGGCANGTEVIQLTPIPSDP
jgi:hypothetical protein